MPTERLLHPLQALRSAIDRLHGCLPRRDEIATLDDGARAHIETAVANVERALIQVRRWVRDVIGELEEDGCAALAAATLALLPRRNTSLGK